MPSIARKVLTEYKIGKTVGEGAFSKVKLGHHRITNERVAVKIISKLRLETSYKKKERDRREREKRAARRKKEKLKKEQEAIRQGKIPTAPPQPKELTAEERRQKKVDEYRAEQKIEEQKEHQTGTFSSTLSREVRLLQSLEHPNIIRLYQVVETEYEYYIITEFAPGGEIIDYIAKKEHLTEKEARRFFRELVSAIDHCHLSGVLHRDLKLENILLSAEKHVLVTDFGLGRSYQAENLCGTFCGTPLYAAPELVSGTKYFGPPADIWAMGVVLYAMVVGKPPFQADNMSELYRRIKNVEFKFPEWCSPEFRDVIGRIFTKDTNERITMDELRTHTWVVGEYGNPPLRLQPEKAIVELNSRDAKIENIRGIVFENDALMFSFHEVTSSRDIQRPRKISQPSHDEDASRFGAAEIVIPRPRPDSTEEVMFSRGGTHNAITTVSSHMAALIMDESTRGSVPSSPAKARVSKKGLIERENAVMGSLSAHRDFRNIHHGVLSAAMQPKAPAPTYRMKTPTDHLNESYRAMINPFVTKMSTNMDSEGEIKQTDIIAAADATGDIKSSKRRRASSAGLASLRFNSSGDVELGDLVDRESSENTANTSNSKRNTLQSSHGTHGVEATEPRRVGNVYSVPIATSEFTPQDLMAEVQRVLTVLNIYFVTTDTYLIACTYDTSAEKVVIEIEIVKVWLVNKLGVQLKRKSGSLWLYKEIYSKIISAMQIPN